MSFQDRPEGRLDGDVRRDRVVQHSRSNSKSPSPDPDLMKYLEEQNVSNSSLPSEAYRKQRIAAGGIIYATKNRVQREREEVERKKREEEEYAAIAYREFVKDMQGDTKSGWHGYSQGGRNQVHSNQERSSGFVRAGGSVYTPEAVKRKESGSHDSSTSAYMVKSIEKVKAFDTEEDEHCRVQEVEKEPIPKRKGAMQDFLGELQRDQARREERLRSRVSESDSISSLLARESRKNESSESHDPRSTNVCILNLPGNVSEDKLGEYFSYFGDVASVKIMWPRMEEARMVMTSNGISVRETKHEGATGFVNFMYKSDAELAHRQIEGSLWKGCLLRTGWGKCLPRPFEPIFSKSDRNKMEFEREQRSKEQPVQHDDQAHVRLKRSRSPGSIPHRRQRPRKDSSSKDDFFDDDGYASFYSTDSEEEIEREKIQKQADLFGKVAKARFDAMLRSLNGRRERIARIMLFALEHAYCARAISDRLIESLLVPLTPIPRKLARIHVISDILHNCSAPASSAWRYRSLFESRLERVFLHWGDVANSFPGRIKREACKDMARQLLDVWESWLIFDAKRLSQWRECVERGSSTTNNCVVDTGPSSNFNLRKGEEREYIEDIDGEAIDDEDIVEANEEVENIDGEAIEDIDGEAM